MSAAVRVPLAEAREIAEELRSTLLTACHRIEIAGSIRRQRADVGDIDLVCEPMVQPALDMFDMETGEGRDMLHERCAYLLEHGHLSQRLNVNGAPSWGKGLKRATFKGLGVDIQAVTDHDSWGFWLLIRTGPALFNKAVVTPKYQGGLLPSGFEIPKGSGFHLYRAGGRVPTPTEADVFDALGIPYVEPHLRGEPASTAGEAGGA